MSGGQNNQQGQGAAGMEAAYYSIAVVAVIAGAWYFYKSQIVTAVFALEIYQAYAMLFVINFVNILFESIFSEATAQAINSFLTPLPLANAVSIMVNTDYNLVQAQQLLFVMSTVGMYFTIFSAPIWITLAAYLYTNANSSRFKQSYSMETLRKNEATNWPFISTVLGTKLAKTGLDEGKFAMSIQPMTFAKKHKLLDEKMVNGVVTVTVNRARAHRIFTLQMGPPWTSNLQDYPPYVLALFAIFAAKGEHDTKSSSFLLSQIAQSSAGGNSKLNFNGAQAILSKHIQSVKISKAVGPHAYLYTALAAMLEYARGDGVIATAEFLWLKTVDRQLWYVLNSVGRQVAFVEVGGPICHFKVEKRLRRPLKTPIIQEAIDALEESVSEIIYKSDDED